MCLQEAYYQFIITNYHLFNYFQEAYFYKGAHDRPAGGYLELRLRYIRPKLFPKEEADEEKCQIEGKRMKGEIKEYFLYDSV